jgi:long-chain acyl-CoA synthetase
MASYKAPRAVRFIEALPTTGAGKVLRRLLKD